MAQRQQSPHGAGFEGISRGADADHSTGDAGVLLLSYTYLALSGQRWARLHGPGLVAYCFQLVAEVGLEPTTSGL